MTLTLRGHQTFVGAFVVDDRVNRIAAVANKAVYSPELTKNYIDVAPHIKHRSLRMLYSNLVVKVYDEAKGHGVNPRVLDIGAGDGTVTLSFLELGAKVVATDISESQLTSLKGKCARFGDRLETRCEDISDTIRNSTEGFDIIVAGSFLHHIPDYLGMIDKLLKMLAPSGQFLSFQDPLRYDSLGTPTRLFSDLSYYSWRVFQGDVLGGLQRWLRRKRGIYLDDCPYDNAEYHVGRNGVDQDAIRHLCLANNVDCRIVSYFSTQNYVFQVLGTWLRMKNTFAAIAKSRKSAPTIDGSNGLHC